MKKTVLIIGLMVLLMGFAGTAGATLVFTTSGAEADFSLSGSTLTVTLTNTSSADVLVPMDVLTALFFNASGTLTPVSATVGTGSSIVYDPAHASTTNVGGEWAYLTGLSGAPLGDNSGISSSGLGLFGGPNFNGPNLAGPTNGALDGLQYGLLSAGDNILTGNTGITGSGGLIKDRVVFDLTVPNGFDINSINSVFFQYGTALNENQVPEPSSLLLLGSGLLGLAFWGRKRFAK